MVGNELKLDATLEAVFDCLAKKQSFILEAGAGSGKTWTLIEGLKFLLREHSAELVASNKKVVCITYTNVAANEIQERIDHNPLVIVSTIHDFLWSVIANYQIELRKILLEVNASSDEPIEDLENILEDRITYWQYGRNLISGKIGHDDVIEFSSRLAKNHPKLTKIIANKYPFIFVDEYQDTNPATVSLLLDELLARESPSISIGFFGDSMQQIYGTGIGPILNPVLTRITKPDNFRCSVKVIALLNKIRDDLVQSPSGNNVQGELLFIHCNDHLGTGLPNYQKMLGYLQDSLGWNLEPSTTKILFLTHKGIAKKMGYEKLLLVYSAWSRYGRERLMDKDEPFISFLLDKIERMVYLYDNKLYAQFMKVRSIEGFPIRLHSEKVELKEKMLQLEELRKGGAVRQVLDFVQLEQLLSLPDDILRFRAKISSFEEYEKKVRDTEFYNGLMDLPYQEVLNVNTFIEELTPFSTKHGVKGAEYENVLVVVDDSSWNQYNFNNVFADDRSNFERHVRTRNLLYVCCSRAKNRLAVMSLSKLDNAALNTLQNWFGAENVYEIEQI